MQSLGQTFHAFRQNKNLTLKEIADEQVSVAVISKFEHDQTTLSINRFLHLLGQINVTTTDFFYHYFDRFENEKVLDIWGVQASFEGILANFYEGNHIASMTNTTDIDEMDALKTYTKAMQLKARQDPTLINRVIAAWMASILDAQQLHFDDSAKTIQPVVDYLTSVGEWNELELIIFVFIIPTADPDVLMQFFRRYLNQAELYQGLPEANNLGFSACFSLFTCMIAKQKGKYAVQVLKKFDKLVTKFESARFAILREFLHGWLKVFQGNRQAELEQCQTVLDLTQTLGLAKTHAYYHELYGHLSASTPTLLIFVRFF
ncbi:Rgg/GadR/MutR family transcriptional regulator [Furfurilactobacillus rossiae]|uniref:HTH cro/C1-type domain-containing protein n=1 Tax=Furfurilactobacillus rossiae DSM 15814 TaxID=1114972 RepID=A0A0R1RB80_9LACO|nr:Rgg/GadR/MutR family transcriptional regulator [Furfurilactobacillus rossiae]KRL53921.1 hypothetical protein FD35_GL000750 [Furfurilactobacillus rossiae DSM 15814]QFR66663.1 hypothetical protein LR814_05955 [Furfurilactobacillus rossiae]QLE62138.1 Positive transcriptional regulator MutR [Furfurilactobacillus rossiae]